MAKSVPKSIVLAEDQAAIQSEIYQTELTELRNQMENMQLRAEESMSNLSLLLDNDGWIELSGYASDGPTLQQIQVAGKKIRNLTGLNAHIGRGSRARYSYIWEGGIHHEGIPESGRGRTNVRNIINDPINRRNFFSASARERQEKACYTNGHYFVIGEDAKGSAPKRLKVLPIWQITAAIVDPDDASDLWAIRRSWSTDGILDIDNNGVLTGDLKHEWIYLNAHKDKEGATVGYNGGREPVNRSKRVFMEAVNRQDGWTWGLPDAIAGMAWADQYRRGMLNGLKMQEALATLAFKIKSQTVKGANSAAAKTAGTGEKGATASMVDGMDIAALATAGRGYDFDSLRPVLAIVATSLDISVVALSSDPGAAGSSYGAGQLLDMPTMLAMEARRLIHAELEEEILRWMGAENAKAWFSPLRDGAELYRELQAFMLPLLQGLYEPQEIRDRTDSFMGWPAGKVPTGVLTPNNSKSLSRRDIDTDAAGGSPTTPAPDQGASNGVGGQGNNSGNDVRTDNI
jgi:hypothetical protein